MMKKSIKYITLCISSFICIITLFVAINLYTNIEELQYPLTMIMPTILFLFLLVGSILLAIWGVKFSNGKAHKTYLFLSFAVLVVITLLFFATTSINNAIGGDVVQGNMTLDAFLAEHKTFSGDDLICLANFDSDSNPNEKIARYIKQESNPDNSKISYIITYDTNSKNIKSILADSTVSPFYTADMKTLNSNPYFHIFVDKVISIMSPNTSIEMVHKEIQFLEEGLCEDNYGELFEDEDVSIFVSLTENNISALIMPK